MRNVMLILAAALGLSVCRGDVLTWSGAVDRNWFEAGNWTPARVPAAGDAVVIDASAAPATNVVLSGDTASLASLSVSGAVLTFTNWTTTVHATNVTIGSGGVFTLPGAFAAGAMSNRIHVVCAALSMLPGSIIDANGAGYGPKAGLGAGSSDYDFGGGGGYGGKGGKGGRLDAPGNTYGIANAPIEPGSGGGSVTVADLAGAGGGAVRIEAPGGTVIINGTLTANGSNGTTGNEGGGSGGSIYITCGTLMDSANGVVRANGGNGMPSGGGGGGGRIAIHYTTLSNCHGIRFSTSPGSGLFGGDMWWMGAGWGTLHLSDTTLLGETLTDHLFTQVRLSADNFSTWAVDALTVSNCSVELAAGGFKLTVTNALTVGVGGAFGVGAERGATNVLLACGDLVLTNGGYLSVYSGTAVSPADYGALVNVTRDVAIGPGSWIYPYSQNLTGGSALFRMNHLRVAPGAGINVIGRGYDVAQGPGKGAAPASRGTGGGHGGQGGGNVNGIAGGNANGSTNAPIAPGSGSGLYFYAGGRGGGVARIEADGDILLDGTITAKGGTRTVWHSGAGAGGSIYIKCRALAGNGSLVADGGLASSLSGGGGGGRIAVDVDTDDLTGEEPGTYVAYAGSANGRVSVTGGTGHVTYGTGTKGTFYLSVVLPPRGTVIQIR